MLRSESGRDNSGITIANMCKNPYFKNAHKRVPPGSPLTSISPPLHLSILTHVGPGLSAAVPLRGQHHCSGRLHLSDTGSKTTNLTTMNLPTINLNNSHPIQPANWHSLRVLLSCFALCDFRVVMPPSQPGGFWLVDREVGAGLWLKGQKQPMRREIDDIYCHN